MENHIVNLLFDDDLNVNEIMPGVLDLAEPLQYVNLLIPQEHNVVARNENYYEIIIPNYTDLQFRSHFRMCRETFELLLNDIGHLHINEDRIPLSKKLMFSVWMLSKPESFLAGGDRFGFAKSTAHKIFFEIIGYICQLLPQYIRWPNIRRHLQTATIFENRSRGFPGVIGAIDGCHIPIKQPEGNAIDFYNRKGFHSIILQGVCDERGLFIDTTIGMPGRMHDARVFRLSPLYAQLTRDNPILPPELHLIGDSAYPLMINLMKPYQDNGHLTNEKTNYNVKLSRIRSIIERAFGLLKCKFRRLKFLDVANDQTASQLIAAACILHNFIILQNNQNDDYNIDAIDGYENDMQGNLENDEAHRDTENRINIVNMCNMLFL